MGSEDCGLESVRCTPPPSRGVLGPRSRVVVWGVACWVGSWTLELGLLSVSGRLGLLVWRWRWRWRWPQVPWLRYAQAVSETAALAQWRNRSGHEQIWHTDGSWPCRLLSVAVRHPLGPSSRLCSPAWWWVRRMPNKGQGQWQAATAADPPHTAIFPTLPSDAPSGLPDPNRLPPTAARHCVGLCPGGVCLDMGRS